MFNLCLGNLTSSRVNFQLRNVLHTEGRNAVAMRRIFPGTQSSRHLTRHKEDLCFVQACSVPARSVPVSWLTLVINYLVLIITDTCLMPLTEVYALALALGSKLEFNPTCNMWFSKQISFFFSNSFVQTSAHDNNYPHKALTIYCYCLLCLRLLSSLICCMLTFVLL